MDIKDILDSLGLDLSNPEVRRGAVEAIEAILASRAPMPGSDLGGAGGGDTEEIELDPDLIQPSIKQAPVGSDEDDIEVEDEEKILDQIKHNESEDPIENTNSDGDSSEARHGSSGDQSSDSSSDQEGEQSDTDEGGSDNSTTSNDEPSSSAEDEEDPSDTDASIEDEPDDTEGDDTDSSTDEDGYDSDDSAEPADEAENTESATDQDGDFDFDPDDEADEEATSEDSDTEDEDTSFKDEEDEDDDFDFDEDDLTDDELSSSAEDEEIKTKHNARKIKRERTLTAAKKTLEDAKAKKVAPALIRELEKAIEALESLTEAVAKSLKDISDEEFNQLVNRVFDAIQACGESGLTFTSEEEREAQVKEIKDDISKAQTQAELSAEDAAKIRAETQAIKARDKEADKYKRKSASSFKGFQEFLNSLYRAIALQVHTEETRDDSWSAINRRYSGTNILKQGQKIQELPNKKIPVIDFYFDQSSSWSDDDIKVGEKAVQSLANMEANGQIKINVYYFSDYVDTDVNSVRGGGTSAWNEIVKNVIATQATNVIIMTDRDMENWWRPQRLPALKYTVPGYVWYLWKNGDNAPRLPRDLAGRGGVQQFAFNASDV